MSLIQNFSDRTLQEKESLRILHLAPFVHIGGLGPIAVGLAREQRAAGQEVEMWSEDTRDEIRATAACRDLDSCISTFPSIARYKLGFSPAMERAVRLTGGRYNILHQHGIWGGMSRVTNIWRDLFHRPTVVNPQGTLDGYTLRRSSWKKRLASMLYETHNLRNATCLHAATQAEVEHFRRYGLTNPIAVLPNGVSPAWLNSHGDGCAFREEFSLPQDKRIALFLSRIHPKKGLPLLIDAAGRLREHFDDWLLVVAGPDEVGQQSELEASARDKGLHDQVRFVGSLFGDAKRNAFAAADLFVLPTYSEGFPLAVLEALAVGVPVLTTHGVPWNGIQTHRCGWWVPVDEPSIRAALLEAVRLPREELQAMGQRGKQLIAQHYTWTQIAAQTISLYDWLLHGGTPPSFVITT